MRFSCILIFFLTRVGIANAQISELEKFSKLNKVKCLEIHKEWGDKIEVEFYSNSAIKSIKIIQIGINYSSKYNFDLSGKRIVDTCMYLDPPVLDNVYDYNWISADELEIYQRPHNKKTDSLYVSTNIKSIGENEEILTVNKLSFESDGIISIDSTKQYYKQQFLYKTYINGVSMKTNDRWISEWNFVMDDAMKLKEVNNAIYRNGELNSCDTIVQKGNSYMTIHRDHFGDRRVLFDKNPMHFRVSKFVNIQDMYTKFISEDWVSDFKKSKKKGQVIVRSKF